jgi:hypothetical protein
MPKETAPLWLGVLLPPAAWCGQLCLIYALALHRNSKPIFILLLAITALALLATIFGAVACSRHVRSEGRPGFLARLGLLGCILYTLTIVAEGIATFMLDSTIF